MIKNLGLNLLCSIGMYVILTIPFLLHIFSNGEYGVKYSHTAVVILGGFCALFGNLLGTFLYKKKYEDIQRKDQ